MSCGVRYKLRELFKSLSAEATAVVNCKKVKPYYPIGEIVPFAAWAGDIKEDEEKNVLSGVLAGYIFDRYGNARTYIIKARRADSGYFEGKSSGELVKYWIDGDQAREQFPDVTLGPDEILVFVKYNNIEFPGNG